MKICKRDARSVDHVIVSKCLGTSSNWERHSIHVTLRWDGAGGGVGRAKVLLKQIALNTLESLREAALVLPAGLVQISMGKSGHLGKSSDFQNVSVNCWPPFVNQWLSIF